MIVSAVRSVNPKVAKQIPDDVGQRLVRITNSKVALTGARWAEHARFLGLLLPPLGILMLAGSVWLAPERRRALVNCLFGVAAAGAVGFIALLVARTLLLRNFSEETTHDAVAALYDNYMGGLANWMLLGGVLAVALAAAAATREPEPLERPRRVLAWFGRAPGLDLGPGRARPAGRDRGDRRVPGADPGGADRRRRWLGAVAHLLRGRRADRDDRAGREPRQGPRAGRARQLPPAASWRTPALAGATIVAAAIAVAFVITDEDKHEVERPPGPVKDCNGYAKLCDRPLDDVSFPAAHNAMSAAELPGWYAPNQRTGIQRQLDDGVRAFLIDTHYGIKRSSGPVLTDLEQEDEGKVNEAVTEQLGARGREAVPPPPGPVRAARGGREARRLPLPHRLRARLDRADQGARLVQGLPRHPPRRGRDPVHRGQRQSRGHGGGLRGERHPALRLRPQARASRSRPCAR